MAKSTEDRVKSVIVEHLGVDLKRVISSARFDDDLGADSLDTVELLMAYEEEFGINITDEQAAKVETVEDAIKLVKEIRGE